MKTAYQETIRLIRIEPDQFGRWMLGYWRGKTRCARPITRGDAVIRYPDKPLGREAIYALHVILGRKPTRDEEAAILDLPVGEPAPCQS